MPPLAATAPPQTIQKPAGQAPAAVSRAGRTDRFATLLALPAQTATVTPVANASPVKIPVAPAPAASPLTVPPATVTPVTATPVVVAGEKPVTSDLAPKTTKIAKADAPPKVAGVASALPAIPLVTVLPSGQPVPVPPAIGLPEPTSAEPDETAHVVTTTGEKPATSVAVAIPSTQAAPVVVIPHQTETRPSKPTIATTTTPLPATPPSVVAPQFAVPVAVPSPIHTHAVSSTAPAASPVAAQIEQPVRLALSVELAGTAQKVSVTLHPAELGRIDVQVARDPAGLVQVTLTADRPETAAKLAADQPALHAALDRAGVAPERVVTVQAAAVPTDAPGFSPQAGGGQGDRAPRQSTPSSSPGFSGTPVSIPQPATPAGATMRLGLDITA